MQDEWKANGNVFIGGHSDDEQGHVGLSGCIRGLWLGRRKINLQSSSSFKTTANVVPCDR